MFDPGAFDLPGNIPDDWSIFLLPHINNKPAPSQMLLCIIGNDTMRIDFLHVPATSRYGSMVLHTIEFMPGTCVVDLDPNLLAHAAKTATHKNVYTALREGLTSKTIPLLESAGILQCEAPQAPEKRHAYIQSVIDIQQTDINMVNAYFNGSFRYTDNKFMIMYIQQRVDGIWTNTPYGVYTNMQNSEMETLQFLDHKQMNIADRNTSPSTYLIQGVYRLVAFDQQRDSVISDPFYIGVVTFEQDGYMHKLHPEGMGYPYYTYPDQKSINIVTSQSGIIVNDTIHYQFTQFQEICDLCLFDNDYMRFVGQQLTDAYYDRLVQAHELQINGTPFTGIATFTFELRGVTVESGGNWFLNQVTYMNTYNNGKLAIQNLH